jgi:hypothetical protein
MGQSMLFRVQRREERPEEKQVNQEKLIEHTKRLAARVTADNYQGMYAEIREFFRVYGGPNNAFLRSLEHELDVFHQYNPSEVLKSVLNSFLDYLEAGLHEDISPERRAQLDVVSDFLAMAQTLLETDGAHPATAAMLVGATLEEFLRTWLEAESLSLDDRKPGIENYSQALRDSGLITKQDGKDITSWAGLRNHAAHGEWNEVSDKNRIALMLEGVNLFMRKYGG